MNRSPNPFFPSEPRGTRRVSRRALVVGGGAVALIGASAAAARIMADPDAPAPSDPARAAAQPTAGATGVPTGSASPTANSVASPIATPPATPPAATGPASPIAGATVAPDLALVTSPRLPLFGIGPDEVDPLLGGEIANWRAVGSAVSLPVEPLALAGATLPNEAPAAAFADYEALVAGLAERRGGVALAPVAAIDFRVNVLSVGGRDPLRDDAGEGSGAEPLLRIAVVGDIVPGRNVHAKMVEYGDFTRPFLKVAPQLAAYDLMIANLEGNLSSTLQQPTDPNTYSFVSDPAMIGGLQLAGIDAVSLANNHSVWNQPEVGWGTQGLLDTIDALDAAAFPYFGAGRTLAQARAPWITDVKGVRVALLGVDGVTANYEVSPGAPNGVVDFDAGAGAETEGTNPWVTSQFLEDIAAAATQADVVIPYFHGGVEYVAVPPRWLVDGAHAAIDAGATLVVTNHPHVVQGMEIYRGRPIVYSPGNFILDQMWSVEVRSGLILDLTLRGDRVVGLRCHGIEIEDFHQPRLMTAGEHAGLMDRFWRSTDRLAGGEFG